MSKIVKFSKTQLSKILKLGGGLIPINLLYPIKMISKAAEKVRDFSKGTSKIINAAKIFGNPVEDIKKGKGITFTKLNFLLVAYYFLLVARYFLLVARYFLLAARYFLLVGCYFLLVACYFFQAFMGNCPTISHTCYPYLPSR